MTVDQVLDAMRAAVAAGGTSEDVLAAARRAAGRASGPAPPDPPAARTAYRAADGEVLDAIARASYGSEYAFTTLIAANRALVDSPPRLAAGTLVGLPPADPPAPEVHPVQIWD